MFIILIMVNNYYSEDYIISLLQKLYTTNIINNNISQEYIRREYINNKNILTQQLYITNKNVIYNLFNELSIVEKTYIYNEYFH